MAVATAASLLAGCQDVGAAPVGEVRVTVAPEGAGALALAGGERVTLDRAWLSLEAVTVEAAAPEADTGGHSHGGEEAPADAEQGAAAVVSAPAVVDLTQAETELHREPYAPAAAYETVSVSVAPAASGQSAGSTLRLAGEMETEAGSRAFAVRWSEEVDDLVSHHADLGLAPGAVRQVRLAVHLDALLVGLSSSDATAEEGVLVIDADADPAIAARLRDNVAAAVQLEDEGEHEHDG